MNFKHVYQPNNYGCLLACVAMFSGKTYEEIEQMAGKPPVAEGYNILTATFILNHLGFYTRHIIRENTAVWPIDLPGIWLLPHRHFVAYFEGLLYDPAQFGPNLQASHGMPSQILLVRGK